MQTAKFTAFVFALSLVTSACGDSMSSLNPTAPSALSPDSVSVEAGASGAMGNGPKPGNGNGNGNNGAGNGNANGNGKQPATTATNPMTGVVQIEGLLSAVGDSSVTVNGQLVAVTSTTVIRKGDLRFELSDLRAGDRVHVTARRVAAANNAATLEATEIKRQNPGEGGGEVPAPTPTGLVSVQAIDANAVEGDSDKAVFRFTRSGDASLLASPLTVTFSLSGSAAAADYSLTSATFAANAATLDVELSAVADGATEGAEDVVLTLTGVAPYTVGSPAAATASINDPPPPASPTVSVAAAEESGLWIFTLTRTGNTSAALTVTIAMGGNAVEGVDYMGGGTSVTFDPTRPTASVLVMPFTSGKTIVMTVVDGAGYDPGSPASATVTTQ